MATSPPEDNGILRCYNLFPKDVGHIDKMTAELPHIAKMGFNAVWINPIHATGEFEKSRKRKGSLYAVSDYWNIKPGFSMTDYKHPAPPSEGPDNKSLPRKDENALQDFTRQAWDNGMTPMFDLVLNHCARDAAMVEGKDPRFKDVDTRKWFKRYESTGNLMIRGLDEHLQRNADRVIWNDVAQFNYNDPKIAREIFDHLWKPYIDTMVGKLGFGGVRLDAASRVPRHMHDLVQSYMDEKCQEKNHRPALIIAETLGVPLDELKRELQGTKIRYVLNSEFFLDTTYGPHTDKRRRDTKHGCELSASDTFAPEENGCKQQIVYLDAEDKMRKDMVGGTIGFSGSHDTKAWGAYLRTAAMDKLYQEYYGKPHEKNTNVERAVIDYIVRKICSERELAYEDNRYSDKLIHEAVERLKGKTAKYVEAGMREKVALVSLMSDAGWFMESGDEFGNTRTKNVFDPRNTNDPTSGMVIKHERQCDISQFVAELNQALTKLPKPEFGSWSERIHVGEERDHELMVIQRHSGFGRHGRIVTVFVGLNPEKQAAVDQEVLQIISKRTGTPISTLIRSMSSEDVVLIGNVKPDLPELGHLPERHTGQIGRG